MQFLNECYSQYIKLIEQSSLLRKNIQKDELIRINMPKSYGSSSSNLSIESDDSPSLQSPRNIIITASTDI